MNDRPDSYCAQLSDRSTARPLERSPHLGTKMASLIRKVNNLLSRATLEQDSGGTFRIVRDAKTAYRMITKDLSNSVLCTPGSAITRLLHCCGKGAEMTLWSSTPRRLVQRTLARQWSCFHSPSKLPANMDFCYSFLLQSSCHSVFALFFVLPVFHSPLLRSFFPHFLSSLSCVSPPLNLRNLTIST